ncbi:MAG: acyl-ACP--UDP-N-acetylglucosamine O-acyltransferase [Planctomycetota bacterium]|jgi:UDP-N-acetylglucosamine acyltransferase
MSIHPTAIIDPRATLGDNVAIGPFCIVDGDVTIGNGCKLVAHVYLTGHTTIGDGSTIHPFTTIGNAPQDLKYDGTRSYCRIGTNCVIRENVTIHRGTQPESETTLGANCFLMVGCHVGHNCCVGDDVTIVNNTLLAGHVEVADRTILSGNSVVHQFCRIGELAMLQGTAGVGRDIVPFAVVDRMGRVSGLNSVGLRRASVPREEILELREAFRELFGKRGTFSSGVESIKASAQSPSAKKLVEFLQGDSKRGFAGPALDAHE